MDWNGDDALDSVKAASWEGIVRATVYLHSHLMQELNVSNPRPHKTPSLPGQAPRTRTGWLKKHVIYELDEANMKSRVGVTKNALYGVFLELGTSRGLRPRPWLWATVRKIWPQLQALVGGGRGGGP